MTVIRSSTTTTHEIDGVRFTSLATPSRGTRDTSVWRIEIAPGTPATPHSVTREEVFVVLEGEAAVEIEGTRATAQAGDAIVVPPGSRVRADQRADDGRCACCAACRSAARRRHRPTARRSPRRGPSEGEATDPAGPALRDGVPRAHREPARAAARARVGRRPPGIRLCSARSARPGDDRYRARDADGDHEAGCIEIDRRDGRCRLPAPGRRRGGRSAASPAAECARPEAAGDRRRKSMRSSRRTGPRQSAPRPPQAPRRSQPCDRVVSRRRPAACSPDLVRRARH